AIRDAGGPRAGARTRAVDCGSGDAGAGAGAGYRPGWLEHSAARSGRQNSMTLLLLWLCWRGNIGEDIPRLLAQIDGDDLLFIGIDLFFTLEHRGRDVFGYPEMLRERCSGEALRLQFRRQ